jgi:hypothetical protein
VIKLAHFARVEDGVVREVIVVDNKDCGNLDFPESEAVGQAFIRSIGLNGVWRQTSYNNNWRGKYAGQGDSFDESLGDHGEFVSPAVAEPVEVPVAAKK